MEYMNEAELLEILKRASDQYYNEGESFLSDREFDSLAIEYQSITGQTYNTETEVKDKKKRLVDISHDFPDLVGTLNKALNLKELNDWFLKKRLEITDELVMIRVTEKYDGNSVVLTFNKDGSLDKALTRGREGKGLDLSQYFKEVKLNTKLDLFKDLPSNLDYKIGVKCECIIKYNNFNKLNEGEKKYSNPRNLTAGILNSLDGVEKKGYLSLVPLDIAINDHDNDFKLKVDIVPYLNKSLLSNIDVVDCVQHTFILDFSIKNDEKFYNDNILGKFQEIYLKYSNITRNQLPYMIDGLVFELIDHVKEDVKKNTIALKFPAIFQKTKMKDIEWYAGKTGRFTPVAIFEPVYFNGAECTNSSLSNVRRFNELKLRKGETVIIEYHGDVLSYLTKDVSFEPKDEELFTIPEKCPYCNSLLVVNDNETFLNCINSSCQINIRGTLVNFFSRNGILGIKEATIDVLLDEFEINSIKDLYDFLDEPEDLLESIEGFGKVKAKQFLKAIKEALDGKDLPTLIHSLNITGIGISNANELLGHLSLNDLFEGDKLINVDKFYELVKKNTITSNILYKGLEDNEELLLFIKEKNDDKEFKFINIKDKSPDVPIVMTVVLSGFRDKSLEALCKEKGIKVNSSVSKKIDYLVVKDVDGNSSKITKAKDLNVGIISRETFEEMVKNM